jgi:hypothetical protein
LGLSFTTLQRLHRFSVAAHTFQRDAVVGERFRRVGLKCERAFDIGQCLGRITLMEPKQAHQMQGGIEILVRRQRLQVKPFGIRKPPRLMQRQRLLDPLDCHETAHSFLVYRLSGASSASYKCTPQLSDDVSHQSSLRPSGRMACVP